MVANTLALLMCLVCVCMCGGVQICFACSNGVYPISTVRVFGTFCRMAEELGDDSLYNTSVSLPVTEAAFANVLRLCEETDYCVPDLDAGSFYEVLGAADYLDIAEGTKKRAFFRNVAKRSFLGAHSSIIVHPGTPNFDSVDFVTGNTYLGLFRGLANALGTDIKVCGRSATICPIDDVQTENDGGVDYMSVIHSLRIHPRVLSVIRHENIWAIIAWFFVHMRISSLSMHECTLVDEDMQGIARLELYELDLSMCIAPRLALTLFASTSLAMRSTLRRLNVSSIKMEAEEVSAIACLSLERLEMRRCILQCGYLMAFGDPACALRRTLRRLELNNNILGIEDIVSIIGIELEVLCLSISGQEAGHLVPLGSDASALKSTLRVLKTACNALGDDDMAVLATLQLTELDIHCCMLPESGLSMLAISTSVLMQTLSTLDVSWSHLRDTDVSVIASMRMLTDLDMSECILPRESIGLLVQGEFLKNTLRILKIPKNKISLREMAAIAEMALVHLDLSNCRLAKGCLVPLCNDRTPLRGSLRTLHASFNHLGFSDIAAISHLRLVELSLIACNLQPGCILALGDHNSTIRETLRKLDVSFNKLALHDLEMIAGMNIEDLRMSKCGLSHEQIAVFESTTPLCNTLHTLNISHNSLCAQDMTTVSGMKLVELIMCSCDLPKGAISLLLAADSPLWHTLRRINATRNKNLDETDKNAFTRAHNLLRVFF